jgi:triacylglycerol lipase
LARFAHGPSGRQMRQDSEWLEHLNGLKAVDAASPAGETGAVKTPVRFTCWYSNCDNIVFPTTTATLQGADNRFVHGAAHLQLAFWPTVMDSTFDLITNSANVAVLDADV